MLRNLQIENYALIRSLDIRFDKGFTAITGETGAGKSILLGALSLILGNRADTDVLNDKSKKCFVEATFDIRELSLQTFFEENDLDYQDETTIRREINEHGKSRAFINDTPVNLTTLRTLASQLLDIHSQHQNLMLQDSGFRLGILDQYAKDSQLLQEYRSKYAHLKQLENEYAKLKSACAEAALQQEFNTFTVNELEQAQLVAGEQEETEQKIQLLSHAEEIKTHLFAASQQLSENDGKNIIQQLKSVQGECNALSNLGNIFEELKSRLQAVTIELQDISYEISRQENEIEVNPQELERLNERIDLIYTLEHKYQVDNIQALLDLAQRLKAEVNAFSDNKEQLIALERNLQTARTEVMTLAQQLSDARQKVTTSFCQEIEHKLRALGMADSRFEISIKRNEEPQAHGIDSIIFLFSANKGVAPAELSKVASGGEMSRLMLALKSIITDSTLLPTVIFDEIDTGISGETANRVAAVMSTLSEHHQVIAITHLPQLAARGDQHLFVYKENLDEKAVSNIRELNDDERIDVLAAMLSGDSITESARNTAKELLHSK